MWELLDDKNHFKMYFVEQYTTYSDVTSWKRFWIQNSVRMWKAITEIIFNEFSNKVIEEIPTPLRFIRLPKCLTFSRFVRFIRVYWLIDWTFDSTTWLKHLWFFTLKKSKFTLAPLAVYSLSCFGQDF